MGKVLETWCLGNGRSDELAHQARAIQGQWGDCDTYSSIFAIRQRGYSKLSQQIFIQNTMVSMQFQEMLKELEKQKPYIAQCAVDKVPISLESKDPDNGNT